MSKRIVYLALFAITVIIIFSFVGCERIDAGNVGIKVNNAGGERAHQEILQRCLVSFQIPFICTRENIKRNGNNLNPEEQHQQRVER